MDFVDLLFATRACEATDPRDKVFALLGVYKPNIICAPEADYSKSVEDVFVETAVFCLRSSNNLGILSLAGSPGGLLPSWVPGLSIKSSMPRLKEWQMEWNRSRDSRRYPRERMELKEESPLVSFSLQQQYTLEVRGTYLDTITGLGGLFDSSSTQAKKDRAQVYEIVAMDSFAKRFWKNIRDYMDDDDSNYLRKTLAMENLPCMSKHCCHPPTDLKYAYDHEFYLKTRP